MEVLNAPKFQEVRMYAVTGITGKVGGTVAQTLLAAGEKVRAVVRDEAKGRPWAAKGCEVAIASIGDAEALTVAFAGADGTFLMTPPNYDPEPGFPPLRLRKQSWQPDRAKSFSCRRSARKSPSPISSTTRR
jgi:uncharacterized protein YbjT (DUF2867 family)